MNDRYIDENTWESQYGDEPDQEESIRWDVYQGLKYLMGDKFKDMCGGEEFDDFHKWMNEQQKVETRKIAWDIKPPF